MMTESERNRLISELTAYTRALIGLKIDRRAGKFVPNKRMDALSARIRIIQEKLYPPINKGETV